MIDPYETPIRDITDPYLSHGKSITLNGLSENEAHGRNVWGLGGEFLGIYDGAGKVRVKGGLFNGEIER